MKYYHRIIFILAFVLNCSVSKAQENSIVYSTPNKSIRQFEEAEWEITLRADFKNPYDQRDIALDMVMVSPSGKPVTLPCFYESLPAKSGAWKARFAPRDTGTYTYYFAFNGKAGQGKSLTGEFRVLPSGKAGFLHKNDFWTFKFDNGELFRGVGENIAWESRSFENDKWTYDCFLPELAADGGNFFRTWMCYWNLPLEWNKVHSTKRYANSDQYFNPGAIKRMDELVRMTDSLHLYFMLTLDWHGHLLEDGGWKNSPYNVVNGGPAKTPTDFFANQEARQRYKNKLRYIIARWGYSPSIAALEFFNEIDNAAFTAADSVIIPHHLITEWHDEMSRYLKDMDPYGHMVTTSVSHRDITGLNTLAYIDFNQKHIYKHTEKIPSIYPQYIQSYGKPYVVGEFGYRWEDADPKYAAEANFDYQRGLWYGLFSPCPVLPMSWWWEFFDEQHMMPYIKSVRAVSERMLGAGKGDFVPFKVSAGLTEAFGVRCGETYFIYILNNSGSEVNTDIIFTARGSVTTARVLDPDRNSLTSVNDFVQDAQSVVLKKFNLKNKKGIILEIK